MTHVVEMKVDEREWDTRDYIEPKSMDRADVATSNTFKFIMIANVYVVEADDEL